MPHPRTGPFSGPTQELLGLYSLLAQQPHPYATVPHLWHEGRKGDSVAPFLTPSPTWRPGIISMEMCLAAFALQDKTALSHVDSLAGSLLCSPGRVLQEEKRKASRASAVHTRPEVKAS